MTGSRGDIDDPDTAGFDDVGSTSDTGSRGDIDDADTAGFDDVGSGPSRQRAETVRADTTIEGVGIDRPASPRRTIEIESDAGPGVSGPGIDRPPSPARTIEIPAEPAPGDSDPTGIAGDGPIASASPPGTDRTVGGFLDDAGEAFDERVGGALERGGRELGERGVPGRAGPQGSRRAGDFTAGVGEGIATTLNVPGFAAMGVRAADETGRQLDPVGPGGVLVPSGDPERTQSQAEITREIPGAAAEQARAEPAQTAGIGGGVVLGGLAVTGAARGASRAGRDIEVDTRGLDRLVADDRAQVGAGRQRRRDRDTGSTGSQSQDTITIGGDDLADVGRTVDPTRGGRFGTRPTGGRSPQDPGQRVGPAADAGTPGGSSLDQGLGFRSPATETGSRQIPRDPLDGRGGRTPAGSAAADATGVGGAGAGNALLTQAQEQQLTGAVETGGTPAPELDSAADMDIGLDSDLAVGPDTDVGLGADTAADTAQRTDATPGLRIGAQSRLGTQSRAAQRMTPATDLDAAVTGSQESVGTGGGGDPFTRLAPRARRSPPRRPPRGRPDRDLDVGPDDVDSVGGFEEALFETPTRSLEEADDLVTDDIDDDLAGGFDGPP